MNSEFNIGNEESESLSSPSDKPMIMMQANKQENLVDSHYDVGSQPLTMDDTYPEIVNLIETDHNISFVSENSDFPDLGSIHFGNNGVLEFNSLDKYIHGNNDEDLPIYPGSIQNGKPKEFRVKKGFKKGPYKKKDPRISLKEKKTIKKKKLYSQNSVLNESPIGLTDTSENAQQGNRQQFLSKEEKSKKSPGLRTTSNIIFDQCYEALGTWRKIIRLRHGENPTRQSDTYIFTPEKKQLRSNVELITYLSKNPKYWPVFDAKVINFEKNDKENPSPITRRVINFLNGVNSGVKVEMAMSIFLGSKSKKIKKISKKSKNNTKNTSIVKGCAFYGKATKNRFGKVQNKTESVVKVYVGQDTPIRNDYGGQSPEVQTLHQDKPVKDTFYELLEKFLDGPKVQVKENYKISTENNYVEIQNQDVKVLVGQNKTAQNDTFEIPLDIEEASKFHFSDHQSKTYKYNIGEIQIKDERNIEASVSQDTTTEVLNDSYETSKLKVSNNQVKTAQNEVPKIQIKKESFGNIYVIQDHITNNDSFEIKNETEENSKVEVLDLHSNTENSFNEIPVFAVHDQPIINGSGKSQNKIEQISKVKALHNQVKTVKIGSGNIKNKSFGIFKNKSEQISKFKVFEDHNYTTTSPKHEIKKNFWLNCRLCSFKTKYEDIIIQHLCSAHIGARKKQEISPSKHGPYCRCSNFCRTQNYTQ